MLVSLPAHVRKRTFLALGGAMAVLLIGSWLFSGNWMADYWQQLQAYRGYSTTQFPLTALAETWLPPSTSQVINALVSTLLLGILAFESWPWRGRGQATFPVALAAVAEEHGKSPFEWCFGACRMIDEADREIRRFITNYKTSQCERYTYTRLLGRNFVSQPATFVSRQAFDEVGEIDLGLTFAMDYDYWLRLGRKYEPRYIPRCLSNFRWHDVSKNGKLFRSALREGYLTAKKHAGQGDWPAVATHWLHYRALSVIYAVA